METKYYTPEIEEFHIGFEYSADRSSDKWEADIFTIDSDINGLSEMLNENLIRVKYLDREDIEDCGWIIAGFGITSDEEVSEFRRSWVTREYTLSQYIDYWEIKNHIAGGVLFKGTIRNKSELKRIMKMINIA